MKMKWFSILFVPFLCFSQTIWHGPEITFTKANNANYTQEQHQDRITADVWLTRSNSGGALINFNLENSYSRGTSPLGTLWAVGSTSSTNLSFDDFRGFDGTSGGLRSGSNSPPINTSLVLKITNGTADESDDIHIDIMFTEWNSKFLGAGFTYIRSTNSNFSAAFNDDTDIFVYPNPTTGLVRTNQDIISQVRVYDLTGRMLMNSNVSRIDLRAYKNGIYFLQLYRSDTNNWVTKRIVKHQ